MVTTLYLIRHCEAEGNITEIFQGRIDCDITPKGERQLDCLAERCKEIPFDIIYSSPLKRAFKTAQAANRFHNVRIIPDEAFAEIDGGEMDGHKWNELASLFPSTYPAWENDFPNFKTETGESMRQVYDRVSRGVMKIVCENQGKSILIVSHGCALRNLCCFLRGLPLSEIDSCPWLDNTAISCYSFDEYFNPTEIFINDCSHINNDPELAPHKMWWGDQEELLTK